jgi:hypothetical protein
MELRRKLGLLSDSEVRHSDNRLTAGGATMRCSGSRGRQVHDTTAPALAEAGSHRPGRRCITSRATQTGKESKLCQHG